MMHIKSSPTTPVVGEKRLRPGKRESPPLEPRKVSSFIQRFYLFGNNTSSTSSGPETETETPTVKKAKASELQTVDVKRDSKPTTRSSSSESTVVGAQSSSEESTPVQYPSYSVQRLRQFWNNRLLSGSNQQTTSGTSIDTLVRKAKSATIGAPTSAAARTVLRKSPSPKVGSRFHRNGSITRSGRRRLTIDSCDSTRIGSDTCLRSTQPPKRSSQAALLSPDREVQCALVEKRQCVGSPTVASGSTVRDSFPVAIASSTGSQIHWARRTELLGIRAVTREVKKQSLKMPLRVENYVNSYIDVDIQSVVEQDHNKAMEVPHELPNDAVEKLPPISNSNTLATPVRQPNTSSLGRKGNTPTRKISFLNNISPYNRKLLSCNGTKVAALTSKFNQMIQQDAGLLEQVQKRGGYLHKCGNVAYKVIEDPGTEGIYGFTTSGRNSVARGSLRKKNSNASIASAGGTASCAASGGNKTDESSDEISSVSSKNSSIRKTGLRKRPSLRKNIYRRPDWETGRSSLGVRKVLEMFEPNLHHARGKRTESGDTGKPPPGRIKPKVPDKSEQVLQKTKSKKVISEGGDRNNKKIQKDTLQATRDVDCVEMMEESVVDGRKHEVTNEKLTDREASMPMFNSCTTLNNSQSIIFTPKHITQQDENSSNKSLTETEECFPVQICSDTTALAGNTEENEVLSEVDNALEVVDSIYDRIGCEDELNSTIHSNEKITTDSNDPIGTVASKNETNEKEKNKSAVSKIHGRLMFRSSKKTNLDLSSPASENLEENVTEENNCFGEQYATYSSIDKGDKNTSETSPEDFVKRNNEMELVALPKEIKEKKKSKSTVSKIYERLTFRSSKKIVTPLEKSDELVIIREEDNCRKTTGQRRSFVSSIEIPSMHLDETSSPPFPPSQHTPELSSGKDTSEQKILDAISVVSQRIDNLSKSFNDLTLSDTELSKENTPPNVEEDIQHVRPNASFLFRGMGAGSSGVDVGDRNASQRSIVEAVNTVVINKSISMDDHHFPCSRREIGRMSLNERSRGQRSVEDGYELVTQPDEKPVPLEGHVFCTTPSITIDFTELTPKIESFVHKSKRESENLYQCISRKSVVSNNSQHLPEDAISINSYESFENYESIEHEALSSTRKQNAEEASREEDTYEICSPPPELPPAREENRNDLTLPQPKRNLSTSPKTLPKHLQVTYQSNYERIKYSKIPPRPPKPEEIPLPPRNNSTTNIATLTNVTLETISSTEATPSSGEDLLDKSPHGQENIYEENIYDTIRSADGVDYDDPACGGSSAEMEPTQASNDQALTRVRPSGSRQQPSPPADSVSLVSSNCYESIGLRLEYDRQLTLTRRNMAGGSTTTLASDQITNSLYGTTAGLASLTPPSERGSDTSNSADWTDISDEDETERIDMAPMAPGSKRPNFIVVRERKRTHQTPLRSRKLARISHPKIDDDSDHHYESLYSVGSNEDRQHHASNYSTSPPADGSVLPGAAGSNFHQHRAGASTAALLLPNDDEFDSFDSDDTEEDYEDDDDERNRARTDSGVDIRNAKLPDPPPSNSQVYVLVQKIKNLGTLSEIAKSFHKLSKKKPSKGGTGATYENATATVLSSKLPGKGTKSSSKTFKLPLPLVGGGGGVPKPPPEDYENAPFAGTHPAPPGSSLLLASSQSSSAVSASNPPLAAMSSPFPEQSHAHSSTGVRSTSESSNVSSNMPGPHQSALADSVARKKSKSTKSLRSKFRKSLVSDSTSLNIGSSFNGSRSTFYVTSADVDSGIFNGSEGCLNPPTSVSQLEMGPSKPLEDNRRKSIASAIGTTSHHRPSIPPPPPPAEAGKRTNITSSLSPLLTTNKSSSKKLGATSWYAECGVFKQPHSFSTGSDQSLSGGKASSISPRSSIPPKNGDGGAADRTLTNNGHTTSSWYADIYQTSGASVASSSESSGVSTGGEGGPGDDHSHSMFVNEPLYQIYNAAKLESITRDIDAEINGSTEAELYDDGYEKIAERNRRRTAAEGDEGGSTSSGSSSTEGDDRNDESSMHLRKPSRPTALELIEPHIGKLRTLWCEIPEVRNSEILATLTPTKKRLQEAKFEILTSEASYLKSLNLLRTHFVNHPAFRDTRILSSSERKTLFSSIIPVQECSDRLLCDLENCWQDNIMLLGLSHSIYKHAEKHFHVYVTYCEHQAKIDRTLKTLRANKPEFARTLTALEADPVCCSLSLSSFLMLPMQRITRMRLLLDAVLQRCHPEDDDEFSSWESTFELINRILTQCNDAAHRSEQLYEMELLSRQIEFPTNVRPLAIVPCGIGAATMHRKLEKRGELVHLLWRGDDAKLTFGKKMSKSNVYAFLFTDLLVLTKKKSDESYLVIDYCQRALLTVSSGDIVPGLPAKEMQTIGKNLIIMTLLENHEGKTIEMFLSCPSETERERWLMVTKPPASENPDEKIYEQWDCPQVIAVHPYQALQPDELDLDIKDKVNVHRKMADGWYEGERIRDGAVGWFPSNYTKEFPSAHIRAKHIKQRHLLLTYTSKYIDTATKAHQHLHHQQQLQHHYHQHGKK
ncbi:uncharacterized protein LOC128305622 [Anopheles moucheti]|uniref:uncharacterized protein LOC128305622 n=1 Tax=Anopheles moucheti TaxID=186751 RepID=UPI0022F02CCE|nr:uncharacterized protein LOC128305622 [Anopheles moucheti]XP_052899127.1 uncharacterized protein LOC128305622 [Anopheles moucheti]